MAVFTTEPPWNSPLGVLDKRTGTVWMHKDWLLYFQKESAFLANLTTSNSTTNVVNQLSLGGSGTGGGGAQQIEDLKNIAKLMIAQGGRDTPGIQALQTQLASNAVNTTQDVYEIFQLSEPGLLIKGQTTTLAALPDSTANLDFYVSWNDISATTNANATIGHSNSAAEFVLVGPPPFAGQSQDVTLLTITNNDVIAANLKLYANNAGNLTIILNNVLLQPGYMLSFDENGFTLYNQFGALIEH